MFIVNADVENGIIYLKTVIHHSIEDGLKIRNRLNTKSEQSNIW